MEIPWWLDSVWHTTASTASTAPCKFPRKISNARGKMHPCARIQLLHPGNVKPKSKQLPVILQRHPNPSFVKKLSLSSKVVCMDTENGALKVQTQNEACSLTLLQQPSDGCRANRKFHVPRPKRQGHEGWMTLLGAFPEETLASGCRSLRLANGIKAGRRIRSFPARALLTPSSQKKIIR